MTDSETLMLKAFTAFRKKDRSFFDVIEKLSISPEILMMRRKNIVVIHKDEKVYFFVLKNEKRAVRFADLVKKINSLFNDIEPSFFEELFEKKEYDELYDDEYEYTFMIEK